MNKQPVKVTTLGLDARCEQILEYAFRKRGDGLCCLSSTGQADIALIDSEHRDADTLFSNFRKANPNLPVIGICREKSDLPLTAQIGKPVDINVLFEVVKEIMSNATKPDKSRITEDKVAQAMKALENKNIAKSLNKRAEESQPKTATRRAMPTKNDEMCFNPERFLLGAVLSARAQAGATNQIAALTCWGDKTIIIDPAQDRISSNLNDNQIRNLAIAPVDDNLSSPIHTQFFSVNAVNPELDKQLKTDGLRQFAQEVFLWNLGLLTCRGRIPAECTISDRQYLRRWPNLTRVIVPNNAMRIIAFWRQQPCSLMEIKEQLDIPFQDVFTLFSAAYAAGLAGEAKRQSDQFLGVLNLEEHKKRGLMRSILGRLRGQKSEPYPKTA